MKFAIVGCGYVADFYMASLTNHADLELVGVYDRDAARQAAFCAFHKVRGFGSLQELLQDDAVKIVANLTNPSSHYAVSRASLEAGKHVYSEKPLAMSIEEAEALVELSEKAGLLLSSAPCSLLGETAQTLWKAIRSNAVGMPRLVYAELDDGNLPATSYETWRSSSGAPWPAKDEFEVGCTLEHAGYYLTWLTAFFGPAARTTSFAHNVQPDKGADKGIRLDVLTPDVAVTCIEFRSGVIARFTCSLYAPHEHRLRIFGDGGWIGTDHSWNYGAPIKIARRHARTYQAEKYPLLAKILGFGPKRLPLVRKPNFRMKARGASPMDFCRGISDIAEALRSGKPPHLTARWALHVNELVLAMQSPDRYGIRYEVRSSFEPLVPMPWAS